MKIVAIHDGKGGHKSQLIGVINGFNKKDIEIIEAKNSILKNLPSFLSEKLLFLLNKNLSDIKEPKAIISIGKKSLVSAIYLKNKYPNAKLIFLMPSGKLSKKYGDLIFYHSYKNINYNNMKYIPILSAPHLITQEKLQSSKKDWEEDFKNFKTPIISVILGGNAKKIELTKKAIDDLVEEIKKIQYLTKGSVFISTSRRTGKGNETYLKEKLKDLIAENKCFFWGYHNNLVKDKNPYLAMLANSNYVIISGESVSMISEACSLPSDVGVYIFFSENFYSKRYIKFHDLMYKNNYAKPLSKFSVATERVSLNSTKLVIDKIKEMTNF